MVDPALGETGSATVRLEVSGMHCISCVSLIEEVLLDVDGVASASFDLEQARGDVSYDPATVTSDQLCDVIVDLGYRATATGTLA
jgi:copper chaperone CopZ